MDMNNNTTLATAFVTAITITKQILYLATMFLGIIFALSGSIMFGMSFFRPQTLLFVLSSLLITLLGLFFIYRGWIGRKANMAFNTPVTHSNRLVVKAYPIRFWPFIRHTFFNPKDMGLPMGLFIFYVCLFVLFYLDNLLDKVLSVGVLIAFILFILWEVTLFFLHWKSWKTLWSGDPLQIVINSGGVSYIRDDDNEGKRVAICDWNEIRRVDFFKDYLKLSTHSKIYHVFFQSSDIEDNGQLLRQVIAQYFLR